MNSLVILISQVIELFIWLLIIQAILSWLVAFGIVNTQSNFVNMVGNFLYKITEPLLKPIRRLLPEFGGVDISPVIFASAFISLTALLVPNNPSCVDRPARVPISVVSPATVAKLFVGDI